MSPSKHSDLTIEVIFKLDGDDGRGWIVGHDNGGYDRGLALTDNRYGGVGSGIGGEYQSGISTPSFDIWHHGIATFRQGVTKGSFVAIDGIIGKKMTAVNSDGHPEFSIGGFKSYLGHGIKGLVRAVFIYETAFYEDTAQLAYRDNFKKLLLNPGPGEKKSISPRFLEYY